MKTAARNIFSWCKTQRLDYHGGPQGQKRRTVHRNLGHLTPPGILIPGSSRQVRCREAGLRGTFEHKRLGSVSARKAWDCWEFQGKARS